jgi:hypothetical protein
VEIFFTWFKIDFIVQGLDQDIFELQDMYDLKSHEEEIEEKSKKLGY